MRVIMRAVVLIYLLLQTGFSRMFSKRAIIVEQNPNIVVSRESTSVSCYDGQTAILNFLDFEFDNFTTLEHPVMYTRNPGFSLKNSSLNEGFHIKEMMSFPKHNKIQFRAYKIIQDVQEEDAGSYESLYRLNVYSPNNKTNIIQIIYNIRILNLIVKPWDSIKPEPYACGYICT